MHAGRREKLRTYTRGRRNSYDTVGASMDDLRMVMTES